MRIPCIASALLLPALLSAQSGTRIILRIDPAAEVKAVPIAARAAIGVEAVDRLSAALDARRAVRLTGARPGAPRLYVVELPDGADADRAIALYRGLPGVARAEPDHLGQGGGDRAFVPNDPHYSKQWGLKNDGSFALAPAIAGADIDMESAWELEQGSPEVTVAIIDSGVRLQHPDWGDRLWVNAGETAGNGIDDDGNGFIDDVQGWDFANDDNIPADDQGHGSNVTSIVAAAGNNGLGLTGADLNCKAMVIKGLDSQNLGYYSWWIAGIYYAVDNGADVISMSMGGTSASPEMQDAVSYALANDVLVVACMMNTNSSTPYYPAALNGVMAVGATKPNDRRAVPFYWSGSSGSNFGPHISVCAPGDYIYGFSHTSGVSYTVYWSGTSQATPHVSALAALLKAQSPARTPAEIRAIIEATAEDQVGDPLEDTPGWDPYHGHGRINAFQALSQAAGVRDDQARALRFSAHPNPSDGAVAISASRPGWLRVHDAAGQLILEQRVASGTTRLGLDLASGLYLMVLTTGNEQRSERLVVR